MVVFPARRRWRSSGTGLRRRWSGPDSVTTQELILKQGQDRPWGNQHELPTVFQGQWLCDGRLHDITTGQLTGTIPGYSGKRGKRFAFSAVAGTTLIGIINHTGDFQNNRDDRKAGATIVLVDISDPAKPKVLSHRNLLAYADPPADLPVTEYLSEFDPLQFAYGYGGTAGCVSHMGGPVPVGNRLLIQTSAFLYCIGEK